MSSVRTEVDRGTGRRRLLIGLAAVSAVGVVVLWAWIDWDWSTIDDPGHVLALNARLAEFGPIVGPFAYVVDMFNFDKAWGLFRPAYWLYPAFFYLLPATAAHLVRLAMVAIAIVGPIIYFRRRGAGPGRTWMTALLVLAAASSLYVGLFFMSLQELSGAAFVGLGLLLPRPWLRTVAWVCAAWFKAPFAWLLIGYGIVLWRRGSRRAALINVLIGAGTLAMAGVMARSGTYTSGYSFDPSLIMWNLGTLLRPMNVMLIVSLLWWLAVTESRLRLRDDTIIFGIAWAGYTVQLLPWTLSAYYMGPVSYLFGLLLVSMLTGPGRISWQRTTVALMVPAMIALYFVGVPVKDGLRMNAIVSGIGRCLESEAGTSTVLSGGVAYVTTTSEGPIRLMENLRLRNPAWQGEIALEDLDGSGFRDPDTDVYVILPGGTLPEGRTAVEFCHAGTAVIYRLGAVR